MSSLTTVKPQPRWLVWVEALGSVALIGWLDYLTGWEWSLFLFYAFPILLVVREMGRDVGFAFAAACGIVWYVANHHDNPYQTRWGFALAGFTRLFYFSVLVVAGAAVRDRVEAARGKIAALERTRELEGEILRASEREKHRLGQDLHDGLGPHLASIGYATTFLADELRLGNHPGAERADQIREMTVKALELTRALARGIFPVQMDSTGLCTALEDLAKTTSALTGVSVEFFESGHPVIGDQESAMHLFRIAQEAVSNALRHSAARTITIGLNRKTDSVNLIIADDGRGMEPQRKHSTSIGLRSMEYRARALHAELHIETRPNEGTIISCEMPDHPHASPQ